MLSVTKRVEKLKESGEDFEWYPTTDEMIRAVSKNVPHVSSMLDIGAGDGRVLTRFDKIQRTKKNDRGEYYGGSINKYAIEKSMVHIELMPADVSIVGTDFMLQTLIDKQVHTIFCNPPYSEFEQWAVKCIKEGNAEYLFLVLPKRWKESKLIKQALKQRDAIMTTIYEGNFHNADRKARAEIEIVKVLLRRDSGRYSRDLDNDPFNVWFDEYFGQFDKLEAVKDDNNQEPKQSFKDIVKGRNLIEVLAECYTKEMQHLLNNYESLSELDMTLLDELGIKKDAVKQGLRQKINGLKHKYWTELFNKLDKITCKLTSSSSGKMLDKLNEHCNVDFSEENAYAILFWVIKNANQYFDSQVVELFKELTEPECIKNYKSNQRTWEKERWRFKNRTQHTHYQLEYRIVAYRYSAIYSNPDGFGKYDYYNGLHEGCHSFIRDVCTVANNFGFNVTNDSRCRHWESGSPEEFYFYGTDSEGKVFVHIRAFKNGNLHLKFNQEFIKTLNVEASRLLGWIKTPQEAAEEMGIDLGFVKSRFKSNLLLGVDEGPKLLAS